MDDDDNRTSMSLLEFLQRTKHLLQFDQTDFVRFVLTGLDIDDTQACIDPIRNRLTEDLHDRLQCIRDYDSLLGISKYIHVNRSLTLYPVAKHDDTLSNNIHIDYEFVSASGRFTEKVHKIPNLCIAKWEVHNMIRVLIPGLHNQANPSPFLTQQDQKTFYEKGLLPAVQDLCPNLADEWPATYDDEMFRATGRNGTLSFQTKMIHRLNVPDLATKIRMHLRLAGVPWWKGIVFLHQVRGVKHSTWHDVEENAAKGALRDFLNSISIDFATISSNGKWWVDVGIQVASSDGNCLAWRTDQHTEVVEELCRISTTHATRITSRGSSKYTRDLISHLPQVSGCRIRPGVQTRGCYEVAYLQLYCTDKTHTYRQDQGHHGKFITCTDIAKGKADKFINSLYSLYINAIDRHRAHARAELRVPLQFADSVFLDVNADVIFNSLVSFPAVEWWSLRAYRAKAIQLVLSWQADGEWQFRSSPMALLLTAACAWLLNGLHSAPDDGPANRDLMKCILPPIPRRGTRDIFFAYGTALDDDADVEDIEEFLPGNPHGLVFFQRIRVGHSYPVPRADGRMAGTLKATSYTYLFGVSREEIGEFYFKRPPHQRPNPPVRSNNKTQRTKRYIRRDDEPPARLFHLEDRGVRLHPLPQDDGSDIEMEEQLVDEVGNDVDAALTSLWKQFIQDVTQKVPNRKSADEDGYCKLTEEIRADPDETLYKNLHLSDYFNDCQWRSASGYEWDRTFNHLFPLESKPQSVQNYYSTCYYPMWENIKRKAVQDSSMDAIRSALKSRFDELAWFPAAQGDKIWVSKSSRYPRYEKFVNHGKPAPWVLVRKGKPKWDDY